MQQELKRLKLYQFTLKVRTPDLWGKDLSEYLLQALNGGLEHVQRNLHSYQTLAEIYNDNAASLEIAQLICGIKELQKEGRIELQRKQT